MVKIKPLDTLTTRCECALKLLEEASEACEAIKTHGKGKEAFERGFKDWELALRYLLEDWDGGYTVETLAKMSEREIASLYSRGGISPWWYVDPEEDDYA